MKGTSHLTPKVQVLMEGLTLLKTLGLAATTHQHQIQVLSHMAQGSLCIFIKGPTVGTKGHLFSPPTNG